MTGLGLAQAGWFKDDRGLGYQLHLVLEQLYLLANGQEMQQTQRPEDPV